MGELLRITDRGLFCPEGDFYIDPWKSVERAVITHAHSDHARSGMKHYLCSREGEEVLRLRVGLKAKIEAWGYGEARSINGVSVSLHPAGHILGSAQIRLEKNGKVAVVSGDYKTEADQTCTPFKPVKCDIFVTESTFGLPIYRWPREGEVLDQVNAWWRENQLAGRATVLLGYSLGKSQRMLAGLNPEIGPIFIHEALEPYAEAYRRQGVKFPAYRLLNEADLGPDWSTAAIVAPSAPSYQQIGRCASAFLSGWMAVASMRKSRGADRGFVMSDHVDWPALLGAVEATGAERVLVTHGYCAAVVRYLREQGLDAHKLETAWDDDPAEEREET